MNKFAKTKKFSSRTYGNWKFLAGKNPNIAMALDKDENSIIQHRHRRCCILTRHPRAELLLN